MGGDRLEKEDLRAKHRVWRFMSELLEPCLFINFDYVVAELDLGARRPVVEVESSEVGAVDGVLSR